MKQRQTVELQLVAERLVLAWVQLSSAVPGWPEGPRGTCGFGFHAAWSELRSDRRLKERSGDDLGGFCAGGGESKIVAGRRRGYPRARPIISHAEYVPAYVTAYVLEGH